MLSSVFRTLALTALAHAQTGSITLVESDAAFEHEVMEGGSCWAILFVSNVPTEPTEHWQMRFELASASLADRIRFGIAAVHETPKAAAEFLTISTPQIGACNKKAKRALGRATLTILLPTSTCVQCSSGMVSALVNELCSRQA